MSDEVKTETTGIDAAMLAVMREIGAIGKNQKNVQQNFNYRGISDIYDAAHAAMANNGVYMLPEVLTHTREERTAKSGGNIICTFMTVRYRFVAGDGSYQECVVPGEGMDSGDKSSNKALAAAHKYAITQSFVIPYSEMVDGDAEMPEQSTKGEYVRVEVNKLTGKPLPQAEKKVTAAEWTGGYIAGLKAIDSVAALNAYTSAYSDALVRLDKVAPDLRDKIEMAIAEARHRIENANPFGGEQQ